MTAKTLVFITLSIAFIAFSNIKAEASVFNKLGSPFPDPLFDLNDLVIDHDKASCPTTPDTIKNLVYTSIYSNKHDGSSIIDDKANTEYQSKVAPLRNYERQIYKWVENSLSGKVKSSQYVFCAYKWLNDWADQNALLDGEISSQGEAVRKWTLSVLSSQYIQIKNVKWIDKSAKREIEDWLLRIAEQVIQDYSKHNQKPSRNNNHVYWAAWSVMITGVATNNRELYKWGVKEYKKAILDMRPDGVLPLELTRKSKAFHYHIFAAAPLIMMAETATANGYNLYRYKGNKLHTLIELIISEIDNNQSQLTKESNFLQDTDKSLNSGHLAWLGVYQKRFNNHDLNNYIIKKYSPLIQRRIGGNISRIYQLED